MSSFYSVLPFLVLNLGGEMVYILDQRLRAQEIGQDRSQKVLQDVVKTMLSKKFVEELFRPQELYTMASVRQIFEKLAHSSIMKLNTTSMNKLFDLMLMGIKFQFTSCASPDEIYFVTMTHLNSMADLVKGTSAEVLINDTINYFRELVANFSAFDYIIIRQELSRFLQDKHIKVSLFIQDGIQGLDGMLYLDFADEGVIFSEKPGTVKLFNPETGEVRQEKEIKFVHSGLWLPNPNTKRFKNSTRPHLGTNMYAAERLKIPVPKRLEDLDKQQQKEKEKGMQDTPTGEEPKGINQGLIMEEINQLANLITPTGDSSSDFKLNLFPETVEGGAMQPQENMINIDLGKQGKNDKVKNVMDQLGKVDLQEALAQNTGDDLLDLMDNS